MSTTHRRICTLGKIGLGVATAFALGIVAAGCGGTKEAKEPKPEKVVKKDTPESLFAEGDAAEKAGKPAVAEKKFRRALRMAPNNYDIASRLSTLLIGQGRPGEAVQVAKAYSDQAPGDLRSYHMLAEAQIGAKDYPGAYDTLSQVVELDEADAAAFERRCHVQILMKKVMEAIPDCRKAVELDGENPEFLISLGTALHRAGQLDEAALNLRGAIRLQETNARAHLLLGNVLREQYEVREALSQHLKAVRYAPNDERAWFELGVTQNRAGDNLGAEQSLHKAVELNPKDATNWYAYGEILRNLQKYDEAIPAYRKAIELDPKHPKAPVKLGFVLAKKGDLDEAEVVLTAALRQNPDNPYIYLNLGRVYSKASKNRLAIEALQKFLELAPPDDGDVKPVKREIRLLKRKVR